MKPTKEKSYLLIIKNKKEISKVHPRTGHEGPKRESRYSFTLSLTSALDEDGWSRAGPGRFTHSKDSVPTV
jgi:hypothetical protein